NGTRMNPALPIDTAGLTLADIARATQAAACGTDMPLPPATGQDGQAVFAQPWQAHAFAMTVELHARGLFTWPQWAQALSAEIRAAQASGDPDDGSRYYHHWLSALEKQVIAARVGTAAQLHALEQAWDAAARRTPHGQPITLAAQDTAALGHQNHQ
ncbi:MAG: nitrile hydratase accessory protein, partial [Pseudomonadota bacterium]|nr:nitrile hydratase accessory protein [Pseudomonadota bacterium]